MPSPRTKPSLTSLTSLPSVPSLTSPVAFGFIALLVYALSIGPLGAMYDAGYISDGSTFHRFLLILYWPLLWCGDNVKWVGSAMDLYIDFCLAWIIHVEFEFVA